MNERDVETLLRAALAAQAHTLVPDGSATRPAPPVAPPEPAALGVVGTSRRNRVWWVSGLVAAVAALVVSAAVVVSSEVDASRPAPAATVVADPSATPTADASTTTAPPPVTTAAVPRPDPSTATGGEVGAGQVTTAATASSPPPDADVVVRADCNEPANDPPVRRPSTISWFCADAGEVLVDVRWSAWSADGATGTGTLRWKTCQPDCASGPIDSRDGVPVQLSQPVDVNGTTFFTHLYVGLYPFTTAPQDGDGKNFTLQTTP